MLAFGNPDLGDPEKNLEYAELEAEEVKNVIPRIDGLCEEGGDRREEQNPFSQL